MNPYVTLETSEKMCVITVTEVSNNMNFTGIIDEVLYEIKGQTEPGTKINFTNELAEYKGDIAVGDRYLCLSFGNTVKDGGNYFIQDFHIYGDENSDYVDQNTKVSGMLKLKKGDISNTPGYKYYVDYSKYMKFHAKDLGVIGTNCLESIKQFCDRDAEIKEGRTFTTEEYEKGSNVCIISQELSCESKLDLGDTLILNFYSNRFSFANTNSDEYRGQRILAKKEYKIVGIYKADLKEEGPFKINDYSIFVPAKTITEEYERYAYKYVAPGDCSIMPLDNDDSERLSKDLNEILEGMPELKGSTVKVYDQGYPKIRTALMEMKKISSLLILGSVISGLVVMLLIAFVYIIKRKKDIAVMFTLGTYKKHIAVSLYVGILIIVLSGGVIGGAMSVVSADKVARYSMRDIGSSEGVDKDIAAGLDINKPEIQPEYIVYVVVSELICIIMLGSIFIMAELRQEPMKLLKNN
jgi:ABC-type antimicrobial peptide transport system permease subunit